MARGLSCSTACGIFPDQGSNPCPLHWQADSSPLCHQGSPRKVLNSGILLMDELCFSNVTAEPTKRKQGTLAEGKDSTDESLEVKGGRKEEEILDNS